MPEFRTFILPNITNRAITRPAINAADRKINVPLPNGIPSTEIWLLSKVICEKCVQQSTIENQSNFFDALIYPNPTNGAFNLDYEIGKNDNGYLIIENAYGQLIDNINLDAQQHSQTFRIKSNIAGVYFISMHINAQLVFTKKLILIN